MSETKHTATEIRARVAANYDSTDGREIHEALLEIAAQLAELNENVKALAKGGQ